MLCFTILFSLFNYAYSDIVYPQYEKEPNHVSSDNIIAMSLWSVSSCMCIKKILDYKKKLPITIHKEENKISKKEYFNIELKDKENVKKDIKKLKKDLNEIRKLLIEYEKML